MECSCKGKRVSFFSLLLEAYEVIATACGDAGSRDIEGFERGCVGFVGSSLGCLERFARLFGLCFCARAKLPWAFTI